MKLVREFGVRYRAVADPVQPPAFGLITGGIS